jgi:predicted exporter
MSKRRLATPLAWLAAMSVCAWLVALTPVVTDINLFLPQGTEAAQFLDEVRSGPAARLVLIGLEGGSEPERAMISQRLAEQLRRTGLFVRVANGAGELTQAQQEWLFARRYLLSPGIGPESFTPDALRQSLQARLRELASPFSTVTKSWLPADPTAAMPALLQAWRDPGQPDRRHGVWFSADGERALLLAETRASGFDPEAQQRALESIDTAFTAVDGTSRVRLLLAGPGVLATLSRDTIRGEAERLSIAATAMVVSLLLIVYRSPTRVLLSILPIGTGVLVATATVGRLFGAVHGVTLAFGITLLGVAVDYPIHVFSHLRDRENVRRCLARLWPTLRLGVVTTALGYSAMVTAGLQGLSQLGVFAVAGLLTAVACTRGLLPALLPGHGGRPPAAIDAAWLCRLSADYRPAAAAILTFGLLLMGLLMYAAPPVWEEDLAALSPVPRHLIERDRALRASLGAPEAGHLIVVSAADVETALQRSERVADKLRALIDDGVVGGFDSPARYLPSRQVQRRRQAALPPRDRLKEQLDEASRGLPFRRDLFEPFLRAAALARTAPLLELRDLEGTLLGLRASALLSPTGEGWLALLPLSGIHQPEALAGAFDGMAEEEGVKYLDLKAETERLMRTMRDTALDRMGWGCGLIVLVLWLGLRSGYRLMGVLLPVLLAIGIDVAVLSALGERLSLLHLVSLLLVLGIALDYSLFFSRPDPHPAARRRTLHALLVCSGSSLAVFGMLSFSNLPVLKAIGQTVAIGVVTAFWMSWALARPASHPPLALDRNC